MGIDVLEALHMSLNRREPEDLGGDRGAYIDKHRYIEESVASHCVPAVGELPFAVIVRSGV